MNWGRFPAEFTAWIASVARREGNERNSPDYSFPEGIRGLGVHGSYVLASQSGASWSPLGGFIL